MLPLLFFTPSEEKDGFKRQYLCFGDFFGDPHSSVSLLPKIDKDRAVIFLMDNRRL